MAGGFDCRTCYKNPVLNFLITAGPTREPIDPVRYITNRSSGKMGYAIADAAVRLGHRVRLISGPVCIDVPPKVDVIRINTADEMYQAVHQQIDWSDVFVMSAAVADFKAVQVEQQKMKKQGKEKLELKLVATRDILQSLRNYKVEPTTHVALADRKRPLIIGFAAETEQMAEAAQKKLTEKNCDVLVANDVSRQDIGFESDHNEVTLYFQNGKQLPIPRISKLELATQMVEIFTNMKKGIDV